MRVHIGRQAHLTNHVRRQRKRSAGRWWPADLCAAPFVTNGMVRRLYPVRVILKMALPIPLQAAISINR